MSWLPGLTQNTKTPSDGEASPRETAARGKALREQVARLRASLAGADGAAREAQERELGRALAEGGGAPLDTDSPRTVVAAVCHAGDKALALQWLEFLKDEASLAEVALEARYAEPRFAAAQRLTEDALLERVAAGTRERDKRVHRHCADILRARSDHVQNESRAAQLAVQLDALAAEPAPLMVARLTQMERALQALGEVPEAASCRERLGQLFLRMRAESEALRQLHQIAGRVDALAVETAAHIWPFAERLEAWRGGLASLRDAALALPEWTAGNATSRAMRAALAAIEAHLAELAADVDLYAAGERFVAELDGPGDPAAWEVLAKPRHATARQLLDAKWAEHQERTRPAPAPVAETARPKAVLDLAAVQKALFALDQAIEQGHVADAERFDARIEKLLGAASLPRSLDARWKRARGEIARLRGWARWGSTQAHDQLIAEAEAKLAEPMNVEALAKAIAGFREEWKKLDATGAAPRAQWERFDALMEKAYKPVAEHRAAQAEQAKKHRAEREAQLAQWECWLAAFDWTQTDWRLVEKKRAELLGAWHGGTRLAPRDERALRKRFDPLVAQLEARLAEARSVEFARRQDLITRALALHEAADLVAAMNETKILQAKWRDEAASVYLGRRNDDDLWKKFRAACDAVFARRDAQRAERAAESEQALAGRRELLKNLEAALGVSSGGELEAALASFQSAWRAGARVPREAEGELDAQARSLTRRASERLADLKSEKRSSRYTMLARKAELAQRVEQAAAAGADVEQVLGEVREAWAALPALGAEAERTLAKRLDAAAAASKATLARGLAQRAELLLDLELALDLPSPAGEAEARRARQLARLKERFSASGTADESAEQKLLRCHALAATVDAGHEARVAAVVRALVDREVKELRAKEERVKEGRLKEERNREGRGREMRGREGRGGRGPR